jgi:hypothetical protein
MPPFWVLFGFVALLALGWSFFNGCHRRDEGYKNRLRSSVSRFPAGTTRKLLRLMAPTKLKDRVNHAIVIAGCICIISTPVLAIALITGYAGVWQAVLAALSGSLAGSFVGEFVVNSRGCALFLPTESSSPAEAGADAPKG